MTNQYHYAPGEEVPVEVLADSTGDVANEGQGVAIVGEGPDGPQVELVEAVSDRCVGILGNTPEALRDPNTTESNISAGNSAGKAQLILAEHVVWMEVDSGYSPTVGDYVEVGDGGDVEAYTGPTATSVGTLTNDLGHDANGVLETTAGSATDLDFTQDAFPFGMVFTTIARGWGVGGRIAVMLTGAK